MEHETWAELFYLFLEVKIFLKCILIDEIYTEIYVYIYGIKCDVLIQGYIVGWLN